MTDIDRDDNTDLAEASRTIASGLQTLSETVAPQPGTSPTLQRRILNMVLRFAGEQLDDETADQIFAELEENAPTVETPGPGVSKDPEGNQ
jgi:hypothetical protein